MNREILRIENLTASGSQNNKIIGANINLLEGETVAMLGLYGSGPRIVLDVLCGLEKPKQGRIYIKEQRVAIENEEDARKAGIFRIGRHDNLIESLSIAENIFIMRRDGLKSNVLRKKAINMLTARLLTEAGLNIPVTTKVSRLTSAQKHLTAIAKAINSGGGIIIFDQAFVDYTYQELESLKSVMTHLKSSGISFIINCSYIEEISLLADKVIFFRGFSISKKMRIEELDKKNIASYLFDESEHQEYRGRIEVKTGREFFTVKHIYLGTNAKPFDISLKKGEILGVVCQDEGARKRMAAVLRGCDDAGGAMVILDGKRLRFNPATGWVNEKIAYISNLWDNNELLHNLSIPENILFPSLKKASGFLGFLGKGNYRVFSREAELKAICAKNDVDKLDYTEVIEIIFARWRYFNPKVMVIYEPFLYSDIMTDAIISRHVLSFAENGTGVILISAKIQKIEDICTRVVRDENGGFQ